MKNRVPLDFGASKVRHGTSSGYTYGCRCIPCKDARIAQVREWQYRNPGKAREYRERSVITASHGTRSRYNRGCRCDDCREANNTYARARRGVRRPAAAVAA